MTEDTSLVPAPAANLQLGQTTLQGNNLILPRVKIVQMMSDENAKGLAKAGDFYNTLTSESYGSEVKFLPLQPFMNRVLLVRDEKRVKAEKAAKIKFSEGDGLKCRSHDMVVGVGEPGGDCQTCPLAQWGEKNEAPLCSEVYNLAALTEYGDLVILQFQKSSAKAGRKLFSMLRFAGAGKAPWARFMVAATHDETIKGKGTFAVPVVTVTQETPPTELIKQAQWWARELGAAGPLDVTPEDDDFVADEGEGGDAPF